MLSPTPADKFSQAVPTNWWNNSYKKRKQCLKVSGWTVSVLGQKCITVLHTICFSDLMREMHEIESQKSSLPPIPASSIKEHIHDNAWAQQYIEDGKVFHVRVK